MTTYLHADTTRLLLSFCTLLIFLSGTLNSFAQTDEEKVKMQNREILIKDLEQKKQELERLGITDGENYSFVYGQLEELNQNLSEKELMELKTLQKIEAGFNRPDNYQALSVTASFCDEIEAFCSDSGVQFENQTNTSAPFGPNYATCGGYITNPSWYYLKIEESGPMQLQLSQQNNFGQGIDVDFMLWGPYSSLETACTQVMNGHPSIQHSFSSSATETIGIGMQGGTSGVCANGLQTPPAPLAGQYYVILITNYNGQSGTISLHQSNSNNSNAGSTDCSMVCEFDDIVLNGITTICPGTSTEITAEGGDSEIIYFQDENPGGENMNNPVGATQGSGIMISEPGTYYFRSHFIGVDENGEDKDCWSSSKAITIQMTEIEIDAGEDQTINCDGSVQLGFDPSPIVPEGYCTPAGTNSSYFINNFTTTGGIENISNSSAFSLGGYGDYTNQILKTTAGASISFNASFGTSSQTYGFRIWVDWNQNGQFNTNEVVYQSSSYANSHSGTIAIPGYAAGVYRMRIVGHWLNSTGDISPCSTTHTYGEFEDYLIQVGPAYDESITYSWEPSEGLSDPTIPNPIASPDSTTTYTLAVEHGVCGVFTDTVTVYVNECLDPVTICPFDAANLNDYLPSEIGVEDFTWYNGDTEDPDTDSQVINPEEAGPGTYWLNSSGRYWRIKVYPDFSQECTECKEVSWEFEHNQTTSQKIFNPDPNEYGFLDFHKVNTLFKITLNDNSISGSNFYFLPAGGANVRFLDGSIWGEGDIDFISNLEGTPDKPILRIVFGPSGVEGFYGSRVSADNQDYLLEPIEIVGGPGFNTNINWNNSAGNTVRIERAGSTSLQLIYHFRSLSIVECVCIDLLTLSVSESEICQGGSFQLIPNVVHPDDASYWQQYVSWTGPNGFTSNEVSPVIFNADSSHAGTYTLTIEYDECFHEKSIEIQTKPCRLPVNPAMRVRTKEN